MDGGFAGPVCIGVDGYRVLVATRPPELVEDYRARAELASDLGGPPDPDAGYLFVAVGDGRPWPQLVIVQRFAPAVAGFRPGLLLVPEAGQLFIGAGTRLAGYDRRAGRWRQTFTDDTDLGFWGWCQHGDIVVMSAELELAAWTVSGERLWGTFVEPPWSYQVVDGQVRLDIMGTVSTFDLRSGPLRPIGG